MKKVSITNARNELSEIVNKACYAGERTIINRQGKDCVAIIPISDLEIIEYVENLIDIRDAEQALIEFEKDGGHTWEDVKKELKL